MTLTEAAENIGREVVYWPHPDGPERGVITSVNFRWVFVRFGEETTSKAAGPALLKFAETSA